MSIFASLVIAGAVAFCADAPSDELCSARELAPVEITFADRAALVALAERLADGYMRPDRGGGSARQPRDDWRIDPRGDCEDRVMWALHELKRTHPNLWRAAEPAMFVFETERASARQRAHGQAELVRFAHVVLIVRTTGGDILVNRHAILTPFEG